MRGCNGGVYIPGSAAPGTGVGERSMVLNGELLSDTGCGLRMAICLYPSSIYVPLLLNQELGSVGQYWSKTKMSCLCIC
jgi:hypothetical protein